MAMALWIFDFFPFSSPTSLLLNVQRELLWCVDDNKTFNNNQRKKLIDFLLIER